MEMWLVTWHLEVCSSESKPWKWGEGWLLTDNPTATTLSTCHSPQMIVPENRLRPCQGGEGTNTPHDLLTLPAYKACSTPSQSASNGSRLQRPHQERGPGLAATAIQADFHSAHASELLWVLKNWRVRIWGWLSVSAG